MTTICIFGDSVVWGAWDEKGGWAERLKIFFGAKNLPNYHKVYNCGVSGDNTTDLLKRFDAEFKTKISEDNKEKRIIMFAIGMNDSQRFRKKARTSEETFKGNIQKLISLAKKFTQIIIFIGLTPVNEALTVNWDINKSYKNEFVKRYNKIIKSVCEENKVYFIEIFEKWKKLNYKSLLEDGLHPNSRGHEKIFQEVKKFLLKNKLL